VPADRHQESILRKLTLAYPCNYTRNDQDDRKEFFRGPVTFAAAGRTSCCRSHIETPPEEEIMKHQLLAASALTTAVGLALAM
jgi:hypothetical protein